MARTELAQSGDMGNEGSQIQARRERLKLSKSELAREASVNRDTLADIEAGKGFQAATLSKLHEALDRLEAEAGMTAAPPAKPGDEGKSLVRFEVKGVYGAEALVVEGPVENIEALEAAVDRIMRRLQGETPGGPTPA